MSFTGFWDTERTSQLNDWWSAGLSAGAIAKKFAALKLVACSPTREAVLGKLDRMGLLNEQRKEVGSHPLPRILPKPRSGPPPRALVRLAEFDPLARRLVHGAPLDAEHDAV